MTIKSIAAALIITAGIAGIAMGGGPLQPLGPVPVPAGNLAVEVSYKKLTLVERGKTLLIQRSRIPLHSSRTTMDGEECG